LEEGWVALADVVDIVNVEAGLRPGLITLAGPYQDPTRVLICTSRARPVSASTHAAGEDSGRLRPAKWKPTSLQIVLER